MKYIFNPFSVEYPIIDSPIGTFVEEACRAATNIKNRAGSQKIALMMSGGLESEIMADAFYLENIEFTPAIGRLKVNVLGNDVVLNSHDIEFALEWCANKNLLPKLIDIDVFNNQQVLCELVNSAQGFSPQYACHMFLMKQLTDEGYFFSAGNGEMDIVFKDDNYYMLDEQREFTLANFVANNKLTGEFQFWKQDGRCIAAYLQLPSVGKYITAKEQNLLVHKHECFADAFVFKPRQKRTGFEALQEWDNILRTQLKKYTGHYDRKYYTPISAFKFNG